MTDTAENFIDALNRTKDALPKLNDEDFPREWLLRVLEVEWAKYTSEAQHINQSDDLVLKGRQALEALRATESNWIGGPLREFLLAYRAVAQLELLSSKEGRSLAIKTDGRRLTMQGRFAGAKQSPMMVNTAKHVRYVPLIEDMLSDPGASRAVVDAFADRINAHKRSLGATHLCFVEKEFGPVGAILMLESLVRATQLKACIFRDGHWSDRAVIAGQIPSSSDRVVIVYDLVDTGSGIRYVAQKLMALCKARTVAAQVLFQFKGNRKMFEIKYSNEHPSICVESFALHDETVPALDQISIRMDPNRAIMDDRGQVIFESAIKTEAALSGDSDVPHGVAPRTRERLDMHRRDVDPVRSWTKRLRSYFKGRSAEREEAREFLKQQEIYYEKSWLEYVAEAKRKTDKTSS